ncbi:hypothetical protein [Kineosporia sp. A_224]|uniref:hypothetical protein n=1 Tax=Kineosporia sp. A_224 TaxID=1962180 RepID=UPI00117B681C|nr:hypothetical protein [Kineosporia sp. A_224]
MSALWVGTRSVLRVMATRRITCRVCEKPMAYRVLERATTIAVVVPLFTPRRSYHLGCTLCESFFDITEDDARWLADPANDLSGYEPRSSAIGAPASRQSYWH